MTAVPPPPAGPMPPAAPVRPRPVTGLATAVTVLAVATWLASLPLFTDGWSDYLDLSEHVSGQQGGPATDRVMATLLLGVGVLLLPPAVLMWVALARLATRPPRGAALMLRCLRAVGGLVLVVALPVLGRTGSVAVIGGVVGIGLAFLGTAQLLAAATRYP